MITKDQAYALNKLESNTHVLWDEIASLSITQPFGFNCRMQTYKNDASPSNPKGLTIDNGAKSAIGASSWNISGQIVHHVGAKSVSCLGRGFQVRADCDAVRKHLNKGE